MVGCLFAAMGNEGVTMSGLLRFGGWALALLVVVSGCQTPTGDDSSPQDPSLLASGSRTADDMVRVGVGFPSGVRANSAVYLERMHPASVNLGDSFEVHLAVTNLTDQAIFHSCNR